MSCHSEPLFHGLIGPVLISTPYPVRCGVRSKGILDTDAQEGFQGQRLGLLG